MLHDVMAAVAAERKPKGTGPKKHYIPFMEDEWERVRKAFGRPNLMPNDVKLLVLALIEGKLTLTAAPPK